MNRIYSASGGSSDDLGMDRILIERGLSRREALRRGAVGLALLSGSGLALGGCAGGRRKAVAELPEINWPDQPLAQKPRPMSRSPSIDRPPQRPHGWTGTVISRSKWAKGGVAPRLMNRALPYYRITVHHDGMDPFGSTNRGDASARLERIRIAHRGRNFGDIGYHYIIDPAGRVWEGRSLAWQGAHVAKTNEGNLGICVMGNFERQTPTSQALVALDEFVVSQMKRFHVPAARVFTHKELKPTLCPGRSLQAHMVSTRRGGALARA